MAVDNLNTSTPPGEKDYAQTPIWFMQALEKAFDFVPSLDVCAEARTAKAPAFYSLADGLDGLALPWSDRNWCNPPFSDVMPWVEKAAKERAEGKTTFMIFPDAPETAYCRRSFEVFASIYHMPFRMRFLRPDGSKFLDAKGREVSPKFATRLVVFSPDESQTIDYFDPRKYLDKVKTSGSKAK